MHSRMAKSFSSTEPHAIFRLSQRQPAQRARAPCAFTIISGLIERDGFHRSADLHQQDRQRKGITYQWKGSFLPRTEPEGKTVWPSTVVCDKRKGGKRHAQNTDRQPTRPNDSRRLQQPGCGPVRQPDRPQPRQTGRNSRHRNRRNSANSQRCHQGKSPLPANCPTKGARSIPRNRQPEDPLLSHRNAAQNPRPSPN